MTQNDLTVVNYCSELPSCTVTNCVTYVFQHFQCIH